MMFISIVNTLCMSQNNKLYEAGYDWLQYMWSNVVEGSKYILKLFKFIIVSYFQCTNLSLLIA